MAFDALAALRAAGIAVDLLSVEQQEVFASLSEEEVSLLISIKRRVDAVEKHDDSHPQDVKIV